MVFGLDDAALVGLIGSGISGGLSLFGQSRAQENQAAQLQLAMQNYLLQKRQADQQYELGTAGRTDARGNRISYIPGRGWVTETTPQTQQLIGASDKAQMEALINQLTRGEGERSLAFGRRSREGAAADPLLAMLQYGPTRGGVSGKNTVANVTQAAENADNIRSGYGSAALRTGAGTVPLAQNMSSIDRGGTAGIRTALARSDTEADPIFQQQLQQYQQGKLNPYNMLATRAGNSTDTPFAPENISGGLDASMGQGAYVGAATGGRGSEALYRGVLPAISAYGAQTQPDYGLFAGGVTQNLKELLRNWNAGSTINDPWGGKTTGSRPITQDEYNRGF